MQYQFTYLRVFEAQFLGELFAIRFTDVLLYLEPFLESATLEIRENGPPHHSSAWFPARVRRPWKNQTGTGKITDTTLDSAWKHGTSAGRAGMMTSGPRASNCQQKAHKTRSFKRYLCNI